MRLFKQWKTALGLAGLFSVGVGSSRAKDLVVGMELAYPPFEMTDAQGKPAGISVEIANALGVYLHRAVRVENIAYDGLIPALKTGAVDCIISSMTANEERAKSVDFSDPYLKTGLSLLFAKASVAKNIGDLNSAARTIAVKKGTTGHTYATQHLGKAKLLVLDKETAAVLEVVQGRADAFIYDEMSVYQNWQRHQDSTRTELKPFSVESWAVALRKGNDDLKKSVNAFLKDFKTKGGFDKLGDKFLSQEKAAFKKQGIPFYF